MQHDLYGSSKPAKIFWIIGLYSILMIIAGFIMGIVGRGWLVFIIGILICGGSIYTSYRLAGGKNNPAISKKK